MVKHSNLSAVTRQINRMSVTDHFVGLAIDRLRLEFCLVQSKFFSKLFCVNNPFMHKCRKMARHSLKNLRCEHHLIFKECLAIFYHYVRNV